ncbi:uncharacterized protein LAESUDRAFT_729856 [Laetiporus sulphureus 93-53]|uniref:DUF6533 domain-containing protein n=1 Tax=Laetiporus sulphureus 93-53 TaxID=1314785 RepID=A0A165CIB6_9APHY|nr:uncharacterized protein LAESUDRAFT_729856 [Laetiporus sulphureus 93-53]KZT02865.1 hypothetical protein LAESUDRAFT_729856 [Laetiporus sulphureus 93-53]
MTDSAVDQAFATAFCQAAITTVLLYDYGLTFGQEVQHFWNGPPSKSAILFFSNRFALWCGAIATGSTWIFFGYIVHQRSVDSDMVEVCNVINIMAILLGSVPYIIWAAFSALRVYAVSERAWSWTALALGTSLVPFLANVWFATKQSCNPDQIVSLWLTTPHLSTSSANIKRVLIATRVSSILSDLMVLSATWYCTYHVLLPRNDSNVKTSLSKLLLRDGSLYFLFLLALNVSHTVIFYIYDIDFLEQFIPSSMIIIISRFMLKIREVHFSTEDPLASDDASYIDEEMPSTYSHLSTVIFHPNTLAVPEPAARVSTRAREDDRVECEQGVHIGIDHCSNHGTDVEQARNSEGRKECWCFS